MSQGLRRISYFFLCALPFLDLAVVAARPLRSPGVYQVPAGARADDAIALAGGVTEEADPASLNLAARLVDGQQIVVKGKTPTPGERSVGSGEMKPAGKLNVNVASAADLDALPGLGPALAQRIVERRQRAGPYQSIEQLRDEKILPAATYERIKELLTVN